MSPLANFNRIDLGQLWLPFLRPLLDVIAACNARGFFYRATCGYRSYVESKALVLSKPNTRVAPPGKCPHNFGVATDFVRLEEGHTDWKPTDYSVLGEETEKAGLVWGGHFKTGNPDCPHVNFPGLSSGEELDGVRLVYEAHLGDDPLSHSFEYLDHLLATGRLQSPTERKQS